MSRSQHKSQGFGVAAQRGSSIEYFSFIKGEKPKNDLFEGLDFSWSRIGHPEIQRAIDSLIQNYQTEHPENSVPGLMQLYKKLSVINDDPNSNYKTLKLKEIENLIVSCSGLYFEVLSSSKNVFVNDSLHLSFVFNNRNEKSVEKAVFYTLGNDSILFDNIQTNKSIQINKNYFIGNDFSISQPYWVKEKMSEGSFEIDDKELSFPENKALQFKLKVGFKNRDTLLLNIPIVYKFTDPVKGEIYEPVFVVTALNVTPERSILISTKEQKAIVKVKFNAGRDIYLDSILINGKRLNISMPLLIKKGKIKELKIELIQGQNIIEAFEGKNKFNTQAKEIHYEHIPDIIYFSESVVNVKKVKVDIAGKRIGYIEGAGDKVKEAMIQMGYDVDLLTQNDFELKNLKKYDAIVTGVRAYNTNQWLNDVYDVMMEYIKEGGLLLAQYNTSNQIGPLKAKIGPYPFTISRDRVTDENAVVHVNSPDLELFNYPNKLDSSDFKGWVQERSVYHASEIDSHYQKPIIMNDMGEPVNDGSLIIGDYGKGKFIYTGLSFFRQLPAGVPGAFRLFANLLSAGK